MKRFAIVAVMAAALVVASAQEASASHPFGFGFQPYGFYQPYGARFRSSTPTPPYFALNPPVYYGARYSRPYGMSPFAAPPMVSAPSGYHGRLRSDFYEGPLREGQPRSMHQAPCANPYVHSASTKPSSITATAKIGKIQANPFVKTADQLVLR